MIPVSPEQIEPDPLEIDPRACLLCGCLIDRHEMIDDGEGPIFYCPEDLETQIHLAAADLVKQWELADSRDAWRHTGEPKPKASDPRTAAKQSNLPPQSTVDAFFYVARQGDRRRLARWLANHPADKAELFKLWKGKRC